MTKRSTPDEFRIPNASELQELRLVADLTQQQVADELDISRASVSHWESGLQSPSLEQARSAIALYAEVYEEKNALWRESAGSASVG